MKTLFCGGLHQALQRRKLSRIKSTYDYPEKLEPPYTSFIDCFNKCDCLSEIEFPEFDR